MFRLLWEELKLYKYYFTSSIILTLLFITYIQYDHFFDYSDGSFQLRKYLIYLIYIPESLKFSKIIKNGYFKLVDKLPISVKDIYFIKFLSNISGLYLIVLIFCIADYFVTIPMTVYEDLSLFTIIITSISILNNETKIFRDSVKEKNIVNFVGMIVLVICYSFISGIYNSQYSLEIGIAIFRNYYFTGILYFVYLNLQMIILFYFLKILRHIMKVIALKIK